jgi:hypothetical protein
MRAAFYDPINGTEMSTEVSTAVEVLTVVDRACTFYRDEASELLPGISLWRTADSPEDSLSPVVATDTWAIIHTDENYFQTVTRSRLSSDGRRRRAYFTDVLGIPAACFVPKELAVGTLATWMKTGNLLNEAGFSDDLHS